MNLPSSTIPTAQRATFVAVRRLPLVVVGLAFVACVCASGPIQPGPRSRPAPAVETPERVNVGAPEVRVAVRTRPSDRISGTYVGDWGQLELALDSDGVTVRGAYGDAGAAVGAEPVGTFVGDLRDGILRGRWCQGPAAGDADFRLKSEDGKTTLDGRWRSDGADDRDDDEGWREDWDVTRVDAGPFAAAAARAHCP